MASHKRPHVHTGDTPGKPEEKNQCFDQKASSRKCLFDDSKEKRKISEWTKEETCALVQYICLYWDDAHTDQWPKTKDMNFWNQCAEAVNKICHYSRSGSSCRTRVLKILSKEFKTLSEAEEKLEINYILDPAPAFGSAHSTPNHRNPESVPLSPVFSCSPNPSTSNQSAGDVITKLVSSFDLMSPKLKLQLLKFLLKRYVNTLGGFEFQKFVTSDFLELTIGGMKTLFNNGKKNLILMLGKCFAQEREGKSRMPIDKMPFGLIDYNIRFYASESIQKLGIEEHYASWLETMYSHFGNKWLCLFRGPMWQYEEEEKSSVIAEALIKSGIDLSGSKIGAGDMCTEISALSIEGIEEVAELIESHSAQQENAFMSASQSIQLLEEHGMSTKISLCNLENTEEILTESLKVTAPHQNTSMSTPPLLEERRVSTLWSNLTLEQQTEIQQGVSSPEEIEHHHQIRPTITSRKHQNSNIYNPLKSKVNVASLGPRQIQKRIQQTGFRRNVKIQMELLQQAKKSNPDARWWIKADASDVRKGLRESIRGVWSGDDDFGDGGLLILYQKYRNRCATISSLCVGGSASRSIEEIEAHLKDDLAFLTTGEYKSKLTYNNALLSHKSENILMELAWDHIGYEELVKHCKCLIEELKSLQESDQFSSISGLNSFRSRILEYLKELYSKKRSAASHLLVFMIADELRNAKPYSIPVRFITYSSITDSKLRDLAKELEDAMTRIGMVVVGVTTDGEFNSLRTSGLHRPISVLELIKNAKLEARKTKVNVISRYFMLDQFGNPLAVHEAVPVEDVVWVDSAVRNVGNSFLDALINLRKKLFPENYQPCPWVAGRAETIAEVQKSLLAIYIYRYKVNQLKVHGQDPADFSKYLYQPERSVSTNERVHQREDHNHLLKRIINCLREGLIPGINLPLLRDALHDPQTGLTYEALTGKNKQSVPDCERLVSPGVISFFERRGSARSARIVKTIHNWHKAVDGRGLDEGKRSQYIKDMKAWILDDWMPWHKENPDYSTIDVNRGIKGICGLTREVIVGLVANLEGRELRRLEYVQRALPQEHPRASSTDDVEGFFALLHEMLGPVFDLKQFFDQLPKILSEFAKRINPNLPFFYWTGANARYRDFELPSFNSPSGQGIVERLDRVILSKRGDPGIFVANRASLPQRGQLTTRAQFHRAPVALPPPQS